ncbi:hypothetical protein D3C75_1163640 [compost metagenome]
MAVDEPCFDDTDRSGIRRKSRHCIILHFLAGEIAKACANPGHSLTQEESGEVHRMASEINQGSPLALLQIIKMGRQPISNGSIMRQANSDVSNGAKQALMENILNR